MERIALHKTIWLGTEVIISTVKLFGEYETMVMFDDGDEIESYVSASLEEAKQTHNSVIRRWADKVFEGSTAQLLGAANYGQFIKTIKAC